MGMWDPPKDFFTVIGEWRSIGEKGKTLRRGGGTVAAV